MRFFQQPAKFKKMMFEEFQHLARLSVVGALEPDEQLLFQAGLREFGKAAEEFLRECRKLNAVFALSLRPCPPDPRTKARLMARINRGEGVRQTRARRADLSALLG
jgi:hypothetical protein